MAKRRLLLTLLFGLLARALLHLIPLSERDGPLLYTMQEVEMAAVAIGLAVVLHQSIGDSHAEFLRGSRIVIGTALVALLWIVCELPMRIAYGTVSSTTHSVVLIAAIVGAIFGAKRLQG